MADSAFLSDNLTLKEIQTALDKVKEPFEIEGCTLAVITADRYSEAIDIMANHFTPDEPLCKAFGVVWEENFERAVTNHLKEHLSVMMLSNADNRVMGVRINGVMKNTDVADGDAVTYAPLRELFKFLSIKDEEVGLFNRFDVKEAMNFFSLGVHQDFRRRGLGTKLLQACVALSKELGFTLIKGVATSNYTQRIYEKEEFEVLDEIPYDTYVYKGEPIRNNTGPHSKTQILAKVI